MRADLLELIKAVGLADLASSALQKAAERLAGSHVASAIEAARAAFATDLPINHDLERGLRLAQLAGYAIVLADHERMDDADRVRRPADPFLKPGFEWVRAQCGVCGRLSVTRNDALVAALEQALDRPLAEANRGEESPEARKAREALECDAWDELCAAIPVTPDQMLEARFFGRIEGEPGWFAAFLAVFREMLKDNPKVRVPYITSRLAQILLEGQRTGALVGTILAEQRQGFADTATRLDQIAAGQARQAGDFGKLWALRRPIAAGGALLLVSVLIVAGIGLSTQQQVGESAAALARIEAARPAEPQEVADLVLRQLASRGLTPGAAQEQLRRIEALSIENALTRRAVETFLRDMGEAAIEPERYAESFAGIVQRYRALLAEAELRAKLPGELEAERALALDAIKSGDLDEADRRLRGIGERLAALRREQQEAWQQTALEEAAVLAERAGLARTRLRYREAAALYQQAAEVASFQPEAVQAFIWLAASALYAQGDEFADNQALEEAIGIYKQIVAATPRNSLPLDWAMAQSALGGGLAILGVREAGTARLEEAVATYRAVLEEWTRERVPLDWARTQSNLGAALQTLGQREAGTTRLEEGVAAYRAALEERTRVRVPLDWALTQSNLGMALVDLGNREAGTSRHEEAIAAFRAALEERTRARVPLDWAITQHALGNALRALGERDGGTARLEEATAAFRAALEERTRARLPLEWARTLDNLGSVLARLGEREVGTARLEQAVAAYRAALEERTRLRVPLEWAATQNNLGNALWMLAMRTSGTSWLREAVAAFRAALEESTRDRVPLDWAATQSNLGGALVLLAEREQGDKRALAVEAAVQAFAASSSALPERLEPHLWSRHQLIRLGALLRPGLRTLDDSSLRQIVAVRRQASDQIRRDLSPQAWAMAQYELGAALQDLGERQGGGATESLEEAAGAYRAALTELRRDTAPQDWARVQVALGSASSALGARTYQHAPFVVAIEAYRSALSVVSREHSPGDWSAIQQRLGAALWTLGEIGGDASLVAEARTVFLAARGTEDRTARPVAWARITERIAWVEKTRGDIARDTDAWRSSGQFAEEAASAFRTASNADGVASMDWLRAQIAAKLAPGALVSE